MSDLPRRHLNSTQCRTLSLARSHSSWSGAWHPDSISKVVEPSPLDNVHHLQRPTWPENLFAGHKILPSKAKVDNVGGPWTVRRSQNFCGTKTVCADPSSVRARICRCYSITELKRRRTIIYQYRQATASAATDTPSATYSPPLRFYAEITSMTIASWTY